MLTTKELIDKLKGTNIKLTISHNKINKITSTNQGYLTGYNFAGRPSGIWYCNEGEWLDFIINNKLKKQYKDCCYLYSLNLNYKNILKLDSISKLNSLKYYYHNAYNFNELVGSLGWKTFPMLSTYITTGITDSYQNLIRDRIIFDNIPEQIKSFQDAFLFKPSVKFLEHFKLPRWDLVQNKYSGVEFSPYIKSYTKKYFWYDSLSVESGCVFNKNGIKDFKLIAEKKGKKWKLNNN